MTATAEAAAPRLRPLALGEILDVAIKICIRNWKTLVIAVAIVVVPVQFLSSLLIGSAFGPGSPFDVEANDPALTDEELLRELYETLGGIAVAGVLGIVAATLATGACLRAIAQAYLGQPTDWRSSLGYALRRLHSLLWVTLIYTLAYGFATLFFIVPGVWLYVAFAFCTPALLVEGQRGFKSLGRSFGLVSGMWWRTFGILVLATILGQVAASIVQTVFFVPLIFSLDNFVLFVVLSAVGGSLGLMVATPFIAAVTTVLYFDLRVRKEAFDLELLAAEIGAALPVAVPAPAPAAPVSPVASVAPPLDGDEPARPPE